MSNAGRHHQYWTLTTTCVQNGPGAIVMQSLPAVLRHYAPVLYFPSGNPCCLNTLIPVVIPGWPPADDFAISTSPPPPSRLNLIDVTMSRLPLCACSPSRAPAEEPRRIKPTLCIGRWFYSGIPDYDDYGLVPFLVTPCDSRHLCQ